MGEKRAACSVCGGPVRSDCEIGICQRTPDCCRAVQRAWRLFLLGELPTCAVCGTWIMRDNRVGICQRTGRCKLAYGAARRRRRQGAA